VIAIAANAGQDMTNPRNGLSSCAAIGVSPALETPCVIRSTRQ